MAADRPERDRQLAARVRHGWRRAAAVGEAMESLFTSEQMRRMRRFQRVTPALRAVLPPPLLAAIQPIRLQEGVLTCAVTDAMAMHELRQHYATALLDALARAGTGVSRLAWRLAPTPRATS